MFLERTAPEFATRDNPAMTGQQLSCAPLAQIKYGVPAILNREFFLRRQMSQEQTCPLLLLAKESLLSCFVLDYFYRICFLISTRSFSASHYHQRQDHLRRCDRIFLVDSPVLMNFRRRIGNTSWTGRQPKGALNGRASA